MSKLIFVRRRIHERYGKSCRVHVRVNRRRNRCGKGESRNRRGFKGFADELEDQNATPISALHPRGTSPGEP